MADLQVLHVPYKVQAPLATDLMGRQIDFAVDSMVSAIPNLASGRLRALAIAGKTRSPQLPEVPTLDEAGVTGHESLAWYGLMAPAGTPRPIVDKLNREMRKILDQPDVRRQTAGLGSEPVHATAVAVVTDRYRDGRQVMGYAFNSFGRYACGGPLRERFIPRLLAARPDHLNDPRTGIIDPARALTLLLGREKLGAHAERSMALGTLEMALWNIVGKMQGKPLFQVLIDVFSTPADPSSRTVPCYVGGRFYKPEDDLRLLGDEVRGYLDAGYTAVKIKAAGVPLADDMRRIESVLALVGHGRQLAVDAGCAFDRHAALAYARAIEP